MLVLNAADIGTLAPIPRVIECLRQAFRSEWFVPPRQVLSLPGGVGERLLLVMPAFDLRGGGMMKLSTVFPDNPARGLPTIQGAIVVLSESGAPVAVLDGGAVTRLRTGAASALASSYLSRAESSHLLIIGTGALAPSMAAAHCAVRPITTVTIWGRHTERALATAHTIQSIVESGTKVFVADSLEAAVGQADIVSCVTGSATPVLAGRWLAPGTFVDLVGSFSPAKREADDEVVLRSRIFVDIWEGALKEAGDLLDPLARGVITRDKIVGELSELVRGGIEGRIQEEEIILFKSVGSAIEDLAVANLVVAEASDKRARREP
jgi:ornithine cyclodeaminase/alanine dehydrogenase-like protein (mu-crystallin family)